MKPDGAELLCLRQIIKEAPDYTIAIDPKVYHDHLHLHHHHHRLCYCRQEFTAYARKALDRLTRSIVQTSSAIQSSKWLAGAKVIYDAVRTRRAAQGLETKPFMEWAGLEHEVDRLVAGLSALSSV